MGSRLLCSFWGVLLSLSLLPRPCHSLSVRFQSQQPLHVILTQSLVLEAQIDRSQEERVTAVTWEREAEGGASTGKVRVAEFPEKASSSRITIEQQGTILMVKDFRHEDRGVYRITVTDQAGARVSAERIVREYEAVHHVSVSINVSHSVLSCGEAWGTDPSFSWLHDSVAVTPQVGRVSADGKTLHLSTTPCGHFTCIVSNSLGHSSATYTADPCERGGSGTVVAVVLLVILQLLGGALAFLLWRRYRRHRNRGERLNDPYEDQL
ncbi:uncharacterized protein si:dkeyp-97a10.2 [Megalops cyprinoides]|uniref:uncharacterized protein si:dkeyp-97a10.2 n=1 Tax=Megalops cyprinoides TaxID=118141 RepID=UPI0018643C9F|nr:uncharacterized protein si:dkeyp-97a10.2 [Megalops cyprinoides]